MTEHRIRWYARVGRCAEAPDGWLPRNSHMAGSGWGWDVRCSCGWESRTGGGIEAYIAQEARDHKRRARLVAEEAIQRRMIADEVARGERPWPTEREAADEAFRRALNVVGV